MVTFSPPVVSPEEGLTEVIARALVAGASGEGGVFPAVTVRVPTVV
jgi:hypothetical protein